METINNNLSLEDMEGETWIDCIGFDGIYEVSNFGRVKSVSRWMETRPGVGFFTKEKIRKLSIDKKTQSVRCGLCKNGQTKPYMVSRLVFFSFNYNTPNLNDYFVMHKDNDTTNNRLNNLKIGTRKEIGHLTFKHKKFEHLKKGNPILSKHKRDKATTSNGFIKSLICDNCNINKPIKFFRNQRNICKVCEADKYYLKNGKKRKRGFTIKETVIKTGKITFYKNFNDPDLLKKVSTTTAIKYAKTGKTCKHNNHHKNTFEDFKLEIIKT